MAHFWRSLYHRSSSLNKSSVIYFEEKSRKSKQRLLDRKLSTLERNQFSVARQSGETQFNKLLV